MDIRIGRPEISTSNKEILFGRIEPYLHIGLSIRKACKEANVSRAWIYTLMQRDSTFADQITRAKEYLGAYFQTFVFRVVSGYCYRILRGEQIEQDGLDFLKWYAVHANVMAELFGRRVSAMSTIDPEIEIRRFTQIMARNRNTQN